jgi:ubiquinone/menaquinone biosynthesis C-methylase UbiE
MGSGNTVDYDGDMAQVYDSGRSLPEASLRKWIDVAAEHVPPSTGFVLDLGAGTGRFSAMLANGLGVGVIALEPAAGMRAQAKPKTSQGRVLLLAGRAEAIPLRADSVGMVWASQVLHHVSDLTACARELRRVLTDSGCVLVRGSFNPHAWVLRPYFQTATEEADVMPRLSHVRQHLAQAGLTEVSHQHVEQVVARDGDELLARTKLRADSVLARLPDSSFHAGLQRLSSDVASGMFSGPVTEELDLVAFGLR